MALREAWNTCCVYLAGAWKNSVNRMPRPRVINLQIMRRARCIQKRAGLQQRWSIQSKGSIVFYAVWSANKIQRGNNHLMKDLADCPQIPWQTPL